jgi:Raf kinase inhibitor-like YbhB/YbcL family protein
VTASSALAQGGGGGGGARGGRGGGGGGGGQGGRGRGVRLMTLTSTGFKDGREMPAKYSQNGAEMSPPLAWSGAPDSTKSFVLVFHDLDAFVGNNGTDDVPHWMLWNIPGTATSLPEHVPQGPQLTDGTRQIAVTGPYYRGPAAPASGPAHHYVFDLYALDITLDVPAVGATPAATRTAVMTAMAGHVRGKATAVVLFRRPKR